MLADEFEAENPPSLKWVARALAAAAVVSTALALGAAYHAPPDSGEIGVVFPPWFDQADGLSAITDAGGFISNTGRFPNVVIAYAPDADFAPRVMARGAWFVAAARGLCAPAVEA